MRSVWAPTIVTCLMATCLVGAARRPALVQRNPDPRDASVLSRAAAYTDRFAEQFLTVVAEERYVQERRVQNASRVRRTLRSDLVLVRPAGADQWMPFRDVFEVDGKAVRNRDERVKRVFLDNPDIAVVTARRIAQESARFCLQPFYRETVDPTLPLLFLSTRNQARFQFTLKGDEMVQGRPAARVDYVEKAVPTIMQYEGADAPASGSLWVQADTGALVKAVVRAVLRKGRMLTRLTIEAAYRSDETLGMSVPSEFRERFESEGLELVGVVTYSNFRRFETGARVVIPR